MELDLIVEKVSSYLGITDTETISKRSHLLCIDVIFSLLLEDSIKDASGVLNVSEDVLEQALRRHFKGRCGKDSKTKWSIFLLGLIEHRKCVTCVEVLPYTDFSVNNSIHNNISNICKKCDSIKSSKYRDAHLLECRARSKKHYLNNKADYLARNANRRALKLKATPSWANLDLIKEKYRTCPIGFHVDHEIPLQGELVCGLHVETNLRHLPAKENLQKSNKFTGK